MAMGEQPRSIWERDAERGWNTITVTCTLILLVCGGCGLLLLLARCNAVLNHPYTPAPPVPSVSVTVEGTPV